MSPGLSGIPPASPAVPPGFTKNHGDTPMARTGVALG